MKKNIISKEKAEIINKLLLSNDFINQMQSVQTPEELQSAFEKNGVSLTLDETKALINSLYASIEEELNDVNGGTSLDSHSNQSIKDICPSKNQKDTTLQNRNSQNTADQFTTVPAIIRDRIASKQISKIKF